MHPPYRCSSMTHCLPSRSTSMVSAATLREVVTVAIERLYLVATKTPQQTPPLLGRGALCADSMGLVSIINYTADYVVLTGSEQGKTLTMLALVLATQSDVPPDYSNTTLIGTPGHLMPPAKRISRCCASRAAIYLV